MTNDQFLRMIKSQVARTAVGPSTVRGRGNAGVMLASRKFLLALDLGRFGDGSVRFAKELDDATLALKSKLPRGARHWGIARKVINIFLRDCLYTTYIDNHYHISESSVALELPLDSITVKQLKRAAGSGSLPRWLGVKHLTPDVSAIFQDAAAAAAKKMGIDRVHLDAAWWSRTRDDDVA